MLTDESGNVACCYRDNVPKRWQAPSGRVYQFKVKNRVSLGWILPADVIAIQRVREGCCGRRHSVAYHLATEDEVSRWRA